MMSAVSQIIVLDDILYAHKLFFCRRYIFKEGVVVAVCLAAATSNLVVVVAMLGDQDSHNLVGNQVFPVCASNWRAITKHNFGCAKVLPCLFKQMLDLCLVSSGHI